MDFYPLHPQPTSIDIVSTAGAVPVTNEKGEVSMQKVKVHRYVSGKRPEYAPMTSSDDSEEEEDFVEARKKRGAEAVSASGQRRKRRRGRSDDESTSASSSGGASSDEERGRRSDRDDDDDDDDEDDRREGERGAGDAEDGADDPRLRRLMMARGQKSRDNQLHPRHRRVVEPEVLDEGGSESEKEGSDEDRMELEEDGEEGAGARGGALVDSSDEEQEADLSDEEIERRRAQLRSRVLSSKPTQEVEALDREEEGQSDAQSEGESSEYEEYSDSEGEESVRLKPVFVRRRERVTLVDKEKEALKRREMETENKRSVEERRKQTLRILEEEIRREAAASGGGKKTGLDGEDEAALGDVNTDDDNDEVEYEAWKQRELKRIKRDRDERDQCEKERVEVERLHSMTEEERRNEFRSNPKTITNKAVKGKYKFMQKYYHRGAFFLDKDDEMYKRDFSEATLDDHFDKTILPRVMQVKNFGRSGRTKYTHLVDQDTTQFDSPWVSDTAHNLKFHSNQAGGMKQLFHRPSTRRK